jgi:hypothetical protein
MKTYSQTFELAMAILKGMPKCHGGYSYAACLRAVKAAFKMDGDFNPPRSLLIPIIAEIQGELCRENNK